MLGLGSVRRAITRITDPRAYVERIDDEVLERMMGFRGQYAAHRSFQIELLRRQGLRPDSKLLEIGCGPLTLGVPVIALLEAGRYTGIDVRPAVLDAAYRLVQRNSLAVKNPRLIHSRTFGESELTTERFDFVVSFSVLYHLEDELVEKLFRAVSGRLATGGSFICNVNVEHEPSRWLEFPFMRREVSFYEDRAGVAGLTIRRLGTGADLGMAVADAASRNVYLAFALAESRLVAPA